MPLGAVTGAQLQAASPGATWFLPNRSGTAWTIEADASGNNDLSLKIDDSDTTGNANEQQLVGMNLTTAIDLTTLGVGGTAQVNFQVASARNGTNKHQIYRLAGEDGTQALGLRWNNDGSFFANEVPVGFAGTLPTLAPNLSPWKSTSSVVYGDADIVAHDGTVNGTFNGVAFTSAFANGQTTIDRFQYHSSGTSVAQRGGFINDITFETFAVPEPSTAALVGLGLLGLTLRRRR